MGPGGMLGPNRELVTDDQPLKFDSLSRFMHHKKIDSITATRS